MAPYMAIPCMVAVGYPSQRTSNAKKRFYVMTLSYSHNQNDINFRVYFYLLYGKTDNPSTEWYCLYLTTSCGRFSIDFGPGYRVIHLRSYILISLTHCPVFALLIVYEEFGVQKQVCRACISNCIPQYSVGCNYLSMPYIHASGSKVLICRRTGSLLFWTMAFW